MGAITARLTELAKEINRCQDRIETSAMDMLEQAKNAGEFLCEVQLELDRGEFAEWVADNIRRPGLEQCKKYMRLARNWKTIGPKVSQGTPLSINNALKMASEAEKQKKSLDKSNPAIEDSPPPDLPPEPTAAEQFRDAKDVARQYGERFLRAVDDVCRLKAQRDHQEAVAEITNALKRLNRWG